MKSVCHPIPILWRLYQLYPDSMFVSGRSAFQKKQRWLWVKTKRYPNHSKKAGIYGWWFIHYGEIHTLGSPPQWCECCFIFTPWILVRYSYHKPSCFMGVISGPNLASLVSGAIGPLHLSLAIPRCATLEICGWCSVTGNVKAPKKRVERCWNPFLVLVITVIWCYFTGIPLMDRSW